MKAFDFHPVTDRWFRSRFAAPTEPQQRGWPSIASGEHTLIAAPTGSGKTLAAFLACIDRLLRDAIDGKLCDEMRVVYVSPLRALSNDMHRNLEVPLAEILALARQEGHNPTPIRAGLRTGDTSSSQRAALVRRPPHILVTTPESLYLLLTAEKGRAALGNVETVIVDEIHALVRDKRGSHLALTLERLEALCGRRLQRIGLSATQRPIERIAEFLVGTGHCDSSHIQQRPSDVENSATDSGAANTDSAAAPACPCHVIDVGHTRELDLAIETPESELGAVCMHEQWEEINARMIELIQQHRSTLIFVNTRRMAERVTHQLTELLGEETVGSHHGSLSAKWRLETERRLKSGELKAVVATASLELGLDIGYVDLVIQLGSPRSIATLLQRIGRSGHSLGLVPKGRLFALTRDELIECMALIRAVRAGRLDVIPIPVAPLDVLAQQIVAEVAAGEWSTDELYNLSRRAYPYRDLDRGEFDRTIAFLSEGLTGSNGRGRVYLHHDQVGRRVRPRRGARIAATSNAGAIPEIASFRVVADPEGTVVGSLDEDFSIESQRGDIFLLGNTSWRILSVRGGDVNVADAQGSPPTVPFWRGEAPGRTLELSQEVSALREELSGRLDDENLAAWLAEATCSSQPAAQQVVDYVAAQKAAIGLLPTQQRVVFERFFDETGGMQLVVHAPLGAAINRAWGLAMRKRFCRSFDFELQATADDDGFILSLGPQHSFPIESLFPMLNAHNARKLLEQAVLTTPMFQVRWRWNITRALLVLRRQNGKKIPPALQRFRADDLLTAVFPKLTGCQENVVGDLELPDHPLTRQTMHDCLTEAMDIDGLIGVLASIERGEISLVARDTREPSPFCYELLNSNVYAFLDGGEIQERRARAVATRRSLSVESLGDLGRLDPEAIEQVCREAQPLVRSADELHDLLLGRVWLPEDEAGRWRTWFSELCEAGRATNLRIASGRAGWVAAERLPAAAAVFPEASVEHDLVIPDGVRRNWTAADARVALVRGLIETCGPTTSGKLAERLTLTDSQTDAALEALEGEGAVLRGRFVPEGSDSGAQSGLETENRSPTSEQETGSNDDDASSVPSPIEWCHRRLLARIHRLTLAGLRRQIEPVGVDVFLRFLTRHHGMATATQLAGANGLYEVVSMLQGIDVPAIAWEQDLLPCRLAEYQAAWLDELCLSGEVGWGRLFPPRRDAQRGKPMAGITRVAPISLFLRGDLEWLTSAQERREQTPLAGSAAALFEILSAHGAMFAADLGKRAQLLSAQLDDALGELVTRGLVTADGFGGLRGLISPKATTGRRGNRRIRPGLARKRAAAGSSGRWSAWRDMLDQCDTGEDQPEQHVEARDTVEQWAWQLLRRWGVVFRDLLIKESGAPSWFDLLQVYRRLEARGLLRGGRFVRGVAGEQFASGDTVRELRRLRDEPAEEELVVICAADPLNLVGVLTDHPRTPSTASNRVAYLDGAPVASLQAGELQLLANLPANLTSMLNQRLNARGAATHRHAIHADDPLPSASETAPRDQTSEPSSTPKRRPRRAAPSGIPRPMIR